MKWTRRQLVSLAAAWAAAGSRTPAAGQSAAAPRANPLLQTPILRAMIDELERSRQLRVVNPDPIYYLEYTLDDAEIFTVAAAFGGLLRERRTRARIPQVVARVGDPSFDNGNYVLSDFYFGSRFDPDQFPLDDNYEALRQAFWLATDRAFKGAVEALGRKRAALRNVTQGEKLPDFAPAPAVERIQPVQRIPVDQAAWRSQAVSLSAAFRQFPQVHDATVEFESLQSMTYFANWEGTVAVNPDILGVVRMQATGQAPDGMRLRDAVVVTSPDPRRLPPESELRRLALRVGENIRALTAAPAAEPYSGPVLFEGEAAAQVFAELLGTALGATRRPVSEPNRPLPLTAGPLEGRIGSRVLPDAFTVVDDPTQREYRGQLLSGYYPIDIEGVVPQPVAVVEKGVLKALLSTRQPTRDTQQSNGRARIPGPFAAKAAAISNLFVKTAEPVSMTQLRAALLKAVTDRGKPFGLLVRKMDFPSSASLAEVRRLAAGQERPVSIPLLVYRVYPDGREELVRGLRFRGFGVRALRDILAASDEETIFHFLGNLAPFSVTGGGGYVYAATVVAPSILVEELELDRAEQDLPKVPLVPPPTDR